MLGFGQLGDDLKEAPVDPQKKLHNHCEIIKVSVKQSGQITSSDSSPIYSWPESQQRPPQHRLLHRLGGRGWLWKSAQQKPLPFTCRGARLRLCTKSAIYNLSDNFPPAGAKKKSITHSGRALHIASQKRLMVRCNFPLFPLIMWQAATPMSCAH